jgi:hypothetical protein
VRVLASRISDEERMERYKKLNLSKQEEVKLMEYDKACEKGERTEFDLPPEKAKIAQKFAHTGTRKTPTAYKWGAKKRKPNATKGGIIAELAGFLENNSQFEIVELQVVNPEKLISFKIGENTFELDLKQKRQKKN